MQVFIEKFSFEDDRVLTTWGEINVDYLLVLTELIYLVMYRNSSYLMILASFWTRNATSFFPFPAAFDIGGGFKTVLNRHRHVMSFADMKRTAWCPNNNSIILPPEPAFSARQGQPQDVLDEIKTRHQWMCAYLSQLTVRECNLCNQCWLNLRVLTGLDFLVLTKSIAASGSEIQGA